MRMRNFAMAAWLIALAILLGTTPVRADIVGSLYVGTLSDSQGGGSFDPSTWNGTALQFLYCVDLVDTIQTGGTYGATVASATGSVEMTRKTVGVETGLVDWNWPANSAKVGQIAWLLDNYGTAGQSAQAVSLQEAIWSVVYGAADTKPVDSGASAMLIALGTNSGTVSSYMWFSPHYATVGAVDPTRQALVGKIPVPEPTSIVLLGVFMLAGALGLGAKRIV